VYYSLQDIVDDARIEGDQQQMDEIEKACSAYMAKHDGRPPASLRELVEPVDGSKPCLDGGQNRLNTVWNDGTAYQYDPNHKDSQGDPDPLVSSRTPGGRVLYASHRNNRK